MVKKINFFAIVIVFGYIIFSKYLSIKVDPCDIECDNCINQDQCVECYEQCYQRTIG